MSKVLVKKIAYHSIAVGGGLASCAQLYNTLEVVLRCSFGLPAHEGKLLAAYLCLAFGISFEFPAAHCMYRRNSLFKPAKALENLPPIAIAVSKKRRTVQGIEISIDALTALTNGGLTFNAVFGLLNLAKEQPLPSILKYVLSALFAIPCTIADFSVNYKNSLSQVKHKPTAVADNSFQYCMGYQLLMIGLPSLVTAIGHGLETLYDGQSSLMELLTSEHTGAIDCQNPLFQFINIGQSLALVAVGLLALAMAFKAGVREKIHIEKSYQKYDGFIGWLKHTFRNILLGLGSLLTSFLNTFPALAAAATFPISDMSKIFLLSSIFLLHGLGSNFVKGAYWQIAMRELYDIAHEWIKKITCCRQQEEDRPLLKDATSASP